MAADVLIARLVTEATVTGGDAATRTLEGLARSGDRAAAAGTALVKVTREEDTAFRSAESSLDKLRAKHDASYRAVQQYSREIERTTGLHRILGTSATEAATDLATLDAKFAGIIARAGGLSAAAQELARLSGVMQRLPSNPGAAPALPVGQIEATATAIGNAEYKAQLLRMQMTDLGTMLAMGGSPFQAMISQSGQISDALAGTNGVKGALALVGSAAMSLLSPINLAIAGFAGLAYGIGYVWEQWNAGAPSMEEALKRQAELARQLKQIYGEAADNAARVQPPNLAEMRFNAGVDVRVLQAESLASSKEFLNGIGAFNRNGFNPSSDFRAFAVPLNEFARSLATGTPAVDAFRAKIVEMAAVAPDTAAELLKLAKGIDDVTKSVETAKKNEFLVRLDPKALAIANRQGQGYEALDKALGSFTGIHDPNAPKPEVNPLRDLKTDPSTVKGSGAATEAAYRQIMATADQRIAQLRIEAATWGMTKEAADAYAIAQKTINDALRDGVKLSADQVSTIKAKAAEEAHLAEMQRQFEAQKKASEEAARKMVEDQKRAAEEAGKFWETNIGGALKQLSRGGDPKQILIDMGFKIGDRLIDEGLAGMVDGKGKGGTGILEWLMGNKAGASGGTADAIANALATSTVGTMTVTAGAVTVMGGLGGLPGINLGGAGAGAGAGTSATSAAPVTPVTRGALPPVTNPAPIPSLGQSVTMGGGGGRFSIQKGENPNIDARLMDILKTASERSGMTVKMTDGLAARKSSTSNHPYGMAADVSIMGPDGRWLNNYHNQRGETFRSYEQFAQEARRYQMEAYPELNDRFRWGGYFSGGRGKYGALDLMHFDLDRNRSGMGGGSWLNGLTPQQRALFPAAQSLGMANMPPTVAKALGIPIPLARPNIMQPAMPIDPASPAALAGNPNVNAIDLGGMFGGALAALLGGKGGAGALIGAIASPLLSALFGKIGFAEGGVADRPSIFGERGAEAAVPLSRGRYIPVEMRTRSSDERPKSRILNYYSGETNFNFTGPISGSEENRKALLAEMDRKMRENNERWAEKLADERANEWRR